MLGTYDEKGTHIDKINCNKKDLSLQYKSLSLTNYLFLFFTNTLFPYFSLKNIKISRGRTISLVMVIMACIFMK